MPYTLIQAGNDLFSVNVAGVPSSALVLPNQVKLASNRVPRFAKFNQYVIVVNTPTRPISVDPSGTVRVLVPNAPVSGTVLTAGTGSLIGTYQALQTYQLLDTSGNIIAESDYGPVDTPIVLASQGLNAAFPTSIIDQVDATQLYRTAATDGEYFPWRQVLGNATTSITNDNTQDAALGQVSGKDLGAAPDLTLCVQWAGRLWGVSRDDIDNLRYTEAGTMYAWSALNTLLIAPIGNDAAGVTALIPRRDALGVVRLDTFQQVTGTDRTSFQPVTVEGGQQVGCVSQESVVVRNDVAYFLWRDGVYKWDSTGITCVTDGQVRSWFATDTYFNRAMFWRSFAEIDTFGLKYKLFLASAGSDVIDHWVEMDLLTGAWYGPHKTSAFSPTSAVLVAGNNQQPYMMIGSLEGYLSNEQAAKNDWDLLPIEADVVTTSNEMGAPDTVKYYGEVSVNGPDVVVAANETAIAQVIPIIDDVETAPMAYDMTQGRQRLGRAGTGRGLQIRITHDTINQDLLVYGYEVNPVSEVGRR